MGGARDAYEDALAAAVPRRAVLPVTPDDPMLLMYTSGTTGVPKGALLPHRKALYNSLNAQLFFETTGRDRVLVALPLFHSFGLKILALPALYAGASLVLERRFSGYGSSMRNIGRVRAMQLTPELARIAIAAQAKHAGLSRELGRNTLFWRAGYALVLYEAEELEFMRGVQAMLSNSDTPFVRELYGGFAIDQVQAARAVNSKANGRGKVAEVIVRNY